MTEKLPWEETLEGLEDRTRYIQREYKPPHIKPSTNGTGNRTSWDPKTKKLSIVPAIPRKDEETTTTVKTGTNANFTGLFFSSLPNYSIKEALSLRSLTGNEILMVAHRENFYTTNEVLNSNIVDLVESRNFYSPTEIIKLQAPDYSYLFQNNLAAYAVSLTSSIVTVSIPSTGLNQSSKIQVETFAPREIKNDTIY
jgi:hypothetical protein